MDGVKYDHVSLIKDILKDNPNINKLTIVTAFHYEGNSVEGGQRQMEGEAAYYGNSNETV